MSGQIMDVERVEQFYESAQDLYFGRIDAELADLASKLKVRRGFMSNDTRVSDLHGEEAPIVVGQSLMVFDQKLTAEERQIAADSQTFAETLVKRLPANTGVAECYKVYNDALLSCGWYSESFTLQEYVTKKLTITMNEAVLQILETVVGAGSGNILNMVVSGIKDLKGDAKSMKVVETGSKKNRTVSFKAVPCYASLDGGVTMAMGALDLVDAKFDGNFLVVSIQTEGVKMFRSAGARRLNKRLFERKKERIYDYIDSFTDDLLVSTVNR